jgi:hypothetical protein
LGVGTTSPQSILHLQSSANPTIRLQDTSYTNRFINLAYTDEGGGEPALTFGISVGSGSVERARIDSSGNVGIGTSSPANKLDVIGSANVNGSLTISPNTNLKNTFTFTTNASNDGRLFIKSNTTDKVDIQANGTSYFEGGTVRFISTISVGNSTPSTSGAGITFPATQSASSDANTLDDYEEGTWTPAVLSGGVGITVNTASYTKIGRMVYLQCDVTIASNSSAAAFQITSLPFPIGGFRYTGVAVGYNTSGTAMSSIIGAADIEFYIVGSATSATNIQASGARFIVATCYQV